MADTLVADPAPRPPSGSPSPTARPGAGQGPATRVLLTGLALALAVAASVALVFHFIGGERARDLLSWQTRLGIVATSRAAALEDWVARQHDELGALANNPSVAIYLGQIQAGRGPNSAEAGYLRNLLTVAADRGGFQVPAKGPDVPANVRRIGVAGLMLFDTKGQLLVGTPNPPPNEGPLRNFLADLNRGWQTADGQAMLDIHRGPAGEIVMGFAVPIFAVQADPRPENQIGVVVGVKPVTSELYPLLAQPGTVERTAEVLLVRRAGDVVQYLSPLASGDAPLARSLAINTPDLAAAYALAHPGSFVEGRDYRGQPVLATSVRIAGTPWTLVHKLDASEALGPIEARLQRLLIIFLLVIGLIAAGVVAVWYKGASRRAATAARRFEDLAGRYSRQRDFLRLLTDSQPSGNAIVDAGGVYRFANERAAMRARMSKDDILDKTMASVLGTDTAKRYEALNDDVLEHGNPVTALHRFEEGGKVSYFQSKHVPMAANEDMGKSVLMVEEDVTSVIAERMRRERILHQTVAALVTVVDRRDPYAANHSARVAEVAEAIADEMVLGELLTETAAFAGRLLNLGKILVPAELLTKTGGLTPAQMKTVRDSIQTSADLIEGIEFDGPVSETLRQCQEHWDGSGTPRKLACNDILVTARVVAVANAFVAMVSPRAHRQGIGFDAATAALLAGVGKTYDQRVVAALINFLDNKSGRYAWAEFVTNSAAPKKNKHGGGTGAKKSKTTRKRK